MADNNVLFATPLALIASLVACVDINFSILTATIISISKQDLILSGLIRLWNLFV